MRRTCARAIVGLMALTLAACGPKMDDLKPGETGKVIAVSDGDTLTLDSGLKVQLTQIIAPRLGFGDRPEDPRARESRATLEKLALGRQARLAYGGAPRFRETTALAQVFVQTEGGRWIWLQLAMLREGMARVRLWKDNHARAEMLYADEARARAAKKGLWADKAYAIRNAAKMKGDEAGFHIVEGAVRRIDKTARRVYLNFGEDIRTDFTIAVNGEDLPAWTASDTPLESLRDKRVRVRGYVSNRGGPLIVVDTPYAIEVLK